MIPVYRALYRAQPLRILDGDTFEGLEELGPHYRMEASHTYRLLGIDTPETRGTTRAAGLAAKEYTGAWFDEAWALADDLLHQVTIEVPTVGRARDNFGRVLCYCYRSDGHELGADLVAAGHATQWSATKWVRVLAGAA